MNQQFQNFLNITITQNLKCELVRVRLAKQFIVAQKLINGNPSLMKNRLLFG
ncbi:unnamed protein product [Paramecium sonneborni]|uniref:Uncharacterized protein n=1 Tax=Paramecium sonneborni TaxID=65129 RepID=A0A8S1KSL4_9CILI|nr:unnamed protein product [Paramecium sonneborni]